MIKVLITGASGFVGSHLADNLSKNSNYQIWGTVWGNPSVTNSFQPVSINLTDAQAVDKLVGEIKPEWIFHLAALSSPSASNSDKHQTLINNVVAEAYLLDAVLKHTPSARTLIVGSAEEYGPVDPDHLPINENEPLKPINPYAVSKVTQDLMAYQYHYRHHLDLVRVRPFNHTGEGQAPQFVIPAFAKQIALIEAQKQEPVLKVGNLSSTRDFSDVLDIVVAYELALKQGLSGDVYNLGSGKETSIQSVLDQLLSLSKVNIKVETDPSRLQAADIPRLRADFNKFNQLTGWEPKIPLDETLSRVLDYWRKETK